jgi:bifunctional enzyme CysN/CysC
MNMIVPTAISATPNGTTRPQVRIVIVGHVDHGKSTLVGRLLHETGSLPEGKLEMLKAVSARRGMPFEWSFLLDALQTERDQGITIDTTQIRFRTRSRDVVLIDAPGHAEFLRNMITGASQADGAVLIIDALEGVRDQTRRHGYLLHLLGVKQVAVVVNKMDRVDFSAARFKEISDEISAHLIGLGVTPSAVIPISARDGDGVAERTPRIGWYAARPWSRRSTRSSRRGRWSAGAAAAGAGDLQIRRPPHRRRPHRVRQPERRRRDRHHARRQDREDQDRRELAGDAGQGAPGAGRSVGITLDRELFIERGDVIAHVGQPARYPPDSRAHFLAARQAAGQGRLDPGPARHAGNPRHRGRDREGGRSRRTLQRGEQSIARNHVGEIDISLAQPIAADPYTDNPRTGRLVIEVNGRIAGGGLVLSVDAGQRAIPVDIVPVESALRPDERSARYRHNGAVVWLTGLPGSGKSTLARALERRLFGNGGSPMLLDGDTCGRPSRRRTAAKTSAASPKSRRISRATATSPSSPRSRPRRRSRRRAPHRRHRVSANLCRNAGRGLREPRPQGPLRQGARRHAAGVHRHRQRLPAADQQRIDDRHLDALGRRRDRRDRADAGKDRHSVRRTGRSRRQYLS